MGEDLDEARPSRCATFLYYTWKICTCLFSHVILVSLVVSYCILGAFTFRSLELDNEIEVKRSISRIRSNVTEDLWTLLQAAEVLHQDNWTATVRGRLRVFEQDLLRAMKSDGWDGSEDEAVVQWTLLGALFYSIIVITTIGYGHIAPKTSWGKVVTIFYAILGIPLMLLCLSNIGDIMAHSFRFLYWKVCCYVCTRRPKRQPSRRGRSVRGPRPPGTRFSGRSRTASFRRSGRTSQRSADSALGLSESLTRSSYSDTDCRYYDEGERDLGTPANRASTHSRYSDTVLPARPPAELADPGDARAPVLFNKYALDREDSVRLPRQEKDRLAVDSPPSPSSALGDSVKSDRRRGGTPQYQGPATPPGTSPSPCRPRIMSPMGFAISRQQSQQQRSSRLSRLREHVDYDDYPVDYGEYSDYEDSNSGTQPLRAQPVPIWLCVFLVVAYILGGAWLFQQWEGWEFLDSAYFCFITLTTIGFGDFVPAHQVNENAAEVSIALCSLYLLFGIALLAMSFNLVQEEVINNVKSVAKRLGIVKSDEEEEE